MRKLFARFIWWCLASNSSVIDANESYRRLSKRIEALEKKVGKK